MIDQLPTWIFIVLLLIVIVPLSVFLCVKLGVWAYLKTKQRFQDQQRKED